MRLWIAVAAGEAHVTIRYMYRGLALLLVVAFAWVACGDETSGPTQADLADARAAADEAAQAVDRLEARVETLEGALDDSSDAADAFGKKLREATKALRASLGEPEDIDRRGPLQRIVGGCGCRFGRGAGGGSGPGSLRARRPVQLPSP